MLQEILKNKNVFEFYFSGKSPGIMAYHGGAIEKGTEQIARTLISHGFAGYIISARSCGFLSAPSLCSRASARVDNAYKNFHVGSTHIKPEDSAKLSQFIKNVDTAIAIHGQVRDDNIYVGGLNENLRIKIAEELSMDFPQVVVSDLKKMPSDLCGTNEKNIINIPINKGVQIELPKNLRLMNDDYDAPADDSNGKKICDAILRVI